MAGGDSAVRPPRRLTPPRPGAGRRASADRTDRKARVLAALLEQIDSGALEPAGTLDVSTPDSVVLR